MRVLITEGTSRDPGAAMSKKTTRDPGGQRPARGLDRRAQRIDPGGHLDVDRAHAPGELQAPRRRGHPAVREDRPVRAERRQTLGADAGARRHHHRGRAQIVGELGDRVRERVAALERSGPWCGGNIGSVSASSRVIMSTTPGGS